ncbi:TetR/AcrR family transcriptional regulator [Paratractidigestivibacter sp.]|uniref:TetR/AcrR family transcriptional regulator n=1 Tax=Paratractidigestivibacter sp. TaxID=2847316 RepID=UPI002ABDEBFC|nr:TetR/AcrR family transcriptional regulator [Paratractidigestivibacter sp.]
MGILNDGRMAADIEKGVRRVRAAKADLAGAAGKLRSDTKTRKSAATREKIMLAATELIVEHNGTDFQMSEVSARCNMSKGSLYYYFSDKEALVEAISDREVEELISQIETVVANASSAVASITGIAGVLSSSLRPRSPLTLAVTRELLNSKQSVLPSVEGRLNRLISIFEAQIDRAKAEGLARPEVNSRLGAISITGAFTFAIFEDRPDDELQDSETFSRELIHLIICGVGTKKARREFGVEEG